jgi:hypothetical protein
MRLIDKFRPLYLLLGLMLAACGTAPASLTPTPTCIPSKTTIDEDSGYPEIRVSASRGLLWALLFTQDRNLRAGVRSRILWKMTDGRGDIGLTAIHEQGIYLTPVWGPVSRQMRSAWKHPGQEWGSEFVFPEPGCWRILVERWLLDTDLAVTGRIQIEVKP